MRRVIPVVLASVLMLSVASGIANADGMILPYPDEVLAPGYLAVRYHHVTVSIEGGHAVTYVEQEFYNPYAYTIEGRYLFPVPPDAILSSFGATVDGQEQDAIHQDAAETNTQLLAIVAQQHDPSLLEYVDWESLAFDLRLEPGSSRTMSLQYEQILAPSGGLYHYHYVLGTERYSSMPLDEVSVSVDVRQSSGLTSVYSPSHDVATERLGPGWARVSWDAQGVTPNQDWELFFAPTEDAFGGGLLTGEREGQNHFVFLFSPEVSPRPSKTMSKDIVFVIDRSGSMSGKKIEQAHNALRFILDQLEDDDRFSIVSFDDRITLLDEYLQPVGGKTIRDAQRFVSGLSADGSTDLEAALQAGLEVLDRSEARGAARMMVFLTDGLPTAGITDEDRIIRLVNGTNNHLEARLHVFGVGYDVNTHLLDRLAADNSGSVTYVQPGESLEMALTGLYAKIAHPVLTDVEVEFEGMEVRDLSPLSIPDLFQGSTLLLVGRYQATGDKVVVRVQGWAGDERQVYAYHYDLEDTGGRDFVPRLWATRQVGAILDRVRVEGETPALVNEIRDLGLSYGIVTPYTTFAIAGQQLGAASEANMDLYSRNDLNQVSGETAVQARVQNQMYQQAAQANLATGSNVSNYGGQSLVQIGVQQVDLTLLRKVADLEGPITGEWVEGNLQVDRTIEFGSDEYLQLAQDPQARPYLQSGTNVVFAYQGEIVSIRDSNAEAVEEPELGIQVQVPNSPHDNMGSAGSQGRHSTGLVVYAARALLSALVRLLPLFGVAMLFGVAVAVFIVRHVAGNWS